ncbi:MAG: MarR family transcriptional regulator [Methylocystaceae bacterium]
MTAAENTLPPEITNTVGLLFLLERRLEYLFDKVLLPHNLTAKQWLLLSVVEKTGNERPSLQEVARQLNTSHQNVKAIALNLEKRGFLALEKDADDKRVTRLRVTQLSKDFWQEREEQDNLMFLQIFQYLTAAETKTLAPLLFKLLYGVQEMTDRIN